VISSWQKLLSTKTRATHINALNEIKTRDPTKLASADLRRTATKIGIPLTVQKLCFSVQN
jgi:hypothetical protein